MTGCDVVKIHPKRGSDAVFTGLRAQRVFSFTVNQGRSRVDGSQVSTFKMGVKKHPKVVVFQHLSRWHRESDKRGPGGAFQTHGLKVH